MVVTIQVVEYKFSYAIYPKLLVWLLRIGHQLTTEIVWVNLQLQLIDAEISRHRWSHLTEIRPQNHHHCDDNFYQIFYELSPSLLPTLFPPYGYNNIN